MLYLLSLGLSVCRTPLHAAIISNNLEAFSLLLATGCLNLELRDISGNTALWLALTVGTFDLEDSESYAQRLIAHGSSPNTLVNDNGKFALESHGSSPNTLVNDNGEFSLESHGSSPNTLVNDNGESALESYGSSASTHVSNNGEFALESHGSLPNTVVNDNGEFALESYGSSTSTLV